MAGTVAAPCIGVTMSANSTAAVVVLKIEALMAAKEIGPAIVICLAAYALFALALVLLD
jgi:hypothetical protein